MREAQATTKGKRCPEGCTCARHKAYYRGGSKKGRAFSEQGRENISQAAQERAARPEHKQRFAEMAKAARQDPEVEARRIAALQEALTGTTCPEGCTCAKHSEETRQKMSEAHLGKELTDEHKARIGDASRATWAARTPEEIAAIMAKRSESLKASWAVEKAEGRVRQTGGYLCSKHELALIPYLEKLGYQHNTTHWVGRRVPDFMDFEGRRIFEYFGSYWHLRSEEEAELIDYYRLLGWECWVLWESDLFDWLSAHKELVTKQEHQTAWRVAHVNNGYRKPVGV
jgi:hypothetical protein